MEAYRAHETRSQVMRKYLAPVVAIQLVFCLGLWATLQSAPGMRLVWVLVGAWVVTDVAVAVLFLLMRKDLFDSMSSLRDQVEQIGPSNLGRRVTSASPREVREAVEAVNAMLDRVEGGYAEQARFIGNVSHELRTPLTYLLGQAQAMRRTARSPEEHDRFVDDVETEVRRMRDTVQSFLTLARARGGLDELSFSRVPVNDLILEATERCLPLAHHRAVRIVPQLLLAGEGTADASLHGDADLLTAMVENLLRNAIQHSPPDGAVDIVLSATPHEISISVRDHGTGIPTEELDTLFERYRNGGGKSAKPESVGLGLAIAKAVALAHGGTVSARNHLDGGAVFEAKLPPAGPSPSGD